MIQANELRIGNFLINGLGEEFRANGYTIAHIMIAHATLGEIKPIPLTEDWLLKMPPEIGEWDSETEMFYFEKSEFIIEKLSNGYFVFRPYSTCNFDVKLKSVHHWQNLFFALTGTELELKK
jgi:hypothetical protein